MTIPSRMRFHVAAAEVDIRQHNEFDRVQKEVARNDIFDFVAAVAGFHFAVQRENRRK